MATPHIAQVPGGHMPGTPGSAACAAALGLALVALKPKKQPEAAAAAAEAPRPVARRVDLSLLRRCRVAESGARDLGGEVAMARRRAGHGR